MDFEMNIRFLESNVQKACHSIKTIDDVYEYISIEGRLVIKQNEQIMFSEDIAAVEFYWYISKWYNAGGIKQKSEFRYTTIEHVEPILFFTYDQDEQWRISSPRMKDAAEIVAEEHILDSQVKKLICCLENDG